MNRVILISILLAASCGEDTTTGVRVALRTQVISDLGSGATFTTNRGWDVQLSEAAMATGPQYYFDGEPAFTYHRPPILRQLFDVLTMSSPAWAHPGHYVAGNAVGEQLASFSADLLSGAPTPLPEGNGVSGPFRSGTFSFANPIAGPAVDVLGGHAVVVAGVATKDGKTVHFSGSVELADLEATAKDAAVTGCVFHEAEVTGDGTVTITVSPRVWFNLVDFGELPEGTAEAPSVLAADSTAHVALALGLTQLSAYTFSYATP